MNGKFNRSQLSAILDKQQIVMTAVRFVDLTYNYYTTKELPAIMDDYLSHLAGGEEWINRKS